ncbi:MAG: cupin domain-containing protein [Chloroflexi bacterium]|nr:cupin domain-containing protein [Chloroflexota bacterium]
MSLEKVQVFKLSNEGTARVSKSNPMHREDLIASPQSWVGVVHTMAGLASPWHHHSDNDTYGYVISGRVRIEFGPGGKELVEVGPGEVFHVPSRVIHREVTVGLESGVGFLVRVGSGEPVVNVDGPEPE